MKRSIVITIAACAALTLMACGNKATEAVESDEIVLMDESAETRVYVDPNTLMDQVSVKLCDYKGIQVEVPMITEVSDEYLNEQINYALEASTQEEYDTETQIKEGDLVSIDYQLYNGDELINEPMEDYYLTIGLNAFIDRAEYELIGKQGGEDVETDVTLSEVYPDENLAGKTVKLKMHINGIVNQTNAVLDDAFIQKISNGECNTVDEYKEYLKSTLIESNEEQKDLTIADTVLQELIDKSEFDGISDELVRAMLDEYLEADREVASEDGMTLEDYIFTWYDMSLEEYEEQLKESAETEIKLRAVFREICKQEKLSVDDVTDEDIAAYAGDQGIEDVDSILEAFGDDFKEQVLYDKVTKILVENADVKVIEMSM